MITAAIKRIRGKGAMLPSALSGILLAKAAGGDVLLEQRLKIIGRILQARIRAAAPVDTGAYRRSIGMEITRSGGRPTLYIGSNAPQARRLEFGFTGIDSLGRRYNQAPRPHFGPAAQATEQGMERLIRGG